MYVCVRARTRVHAVCTHTSHTYTAHRSQKGVPDPLELGLELQMIVAAVWVPGNDLCLLQGQPQQLLTSLNNCAISPALPLLC